VAWNFSGWKEAHVKSSLLTIISHLGPAHLQPVSPGLGETPWRDSLVRLGETPWRDLARLGEPWRDSLARLGETPWRDSAKQTTLFTHPYWLHIFLQAPANFYIC